MKNDAAARAAGLRVLATVRDAVRSLDRVARVVAPPSAWPRFPGGSRWRWSFSCGRSEGFGFGGEVRVPVAAVR